MFAFIGRKFKGLIFFAIISTLFIGAGVASAQGILNLPTDPVCANHGPWNQGTLGSTLDITLSQVPPGFDVMDGTYAGWCLEDNHQPNSPPNCLTFLYDSTGTSLPSIYSGFPWDLINYLINNKAGTAEDVNVALWLLMGFYDSTFPRTADAEGMYSNALANGAGFVPGPGQIVAVILEGDGIGLNGYQDTIIEVPVPPDDGGEGCTPGYWRNHLEDWLPTGYSPGDDFDTTFGVDYFDPDITLNQAVRLGGGGVKKLARHGAAALLSAAHPDVDYPYTVSEVIAFVQAGDAEPLVVANELGCVIP